MKIAIISCNLHYPWGGMDKLCTQTARLALAEEHRVFFAVSPQVAAHPAMRQLHNAGATVHQRAGFTQFNGRRARWQSSLQRWLGHPRSLIAALDRFQPDLLVLDQGGEFDFLVEDGLMHWLRERGVPYVLFCHSNAEDDRPPDGQLPLAREIARDAARFLFLSTHNRTLAERQLAISLPNAVTLRNSIDQPLTPFLWPDDATTRLAVVGRLERGAKGLDVLIPALAQALGGQPGWSADFFGRGPDESAIREHARAVGIVDRLNFRGFQDDVAAIWHDHHLLLLPSRREGCPRVMLEAFACGRPVLMTDVGGASDWIEPGVNGFLCPRCEVDPLAETLRIAWRARARWRELGTAAQRSAQRLDPAPDRTLLDLLVSLGATHRRGVARPV